MSKTKLTPVQQRRLWSLLVMASQGKFGTLYDEDHAYDEDLEAYIKRVEAILSLPKDAL